MGSSSSPNDPLFWLHHAKPRPNLGGMDRHGIFNFPSEWYYLDASSRRSRSRRRILFGIPGGTGYPRTVTSLDTLVIRASGPIRPQPEAGATHGRRDHWGGASPGELVTVKVASLRGLRYQLQSAPRPSGPWTDAGAPGCGIPRSDVRPSGGIRGIPSAFLPAQTDPCRQRCCRPRRPCVGPPPGTIRSAVHSRSSVERRERSLFLFEHPGATSGRPRDIAPGFRQPRPHTPICAKFCFPPGSRGLDLTY